MIDKKTKDSLRDKHILCFGTSPSFFIQNPLRIEWFGAYSSLHGANRLTSAVNVYMLASVSEHNDKVIRIVSNQYPAINLALDASTSNAEKGSATDLIFHLIHSLKEKKLLFKKGINLFIESETKHQFHVGSSTSFLLVTLEAILFVFKDQISLSIEEKFRLIHTIELLQISFPHHVADALPMLLGGTQIHAMDIQYNPIYQRHIGNLKQYKILSLSIVNYVYQPQLSMKNIVEHMNIIAHHYQQKRLADVDYLQFQHDEQHLLHLYGSKTLAKAHHFFTETLAVKQSYLAMEKEDEHTFFNLIKLAQKRDLESLEHHIVAAPSEQKITNTLKWIQATFPRIAFRIHGFGFQGDFILLIPIDEYKDVFHRLKKQFYADQLKEINFVNQGIRIFKS